MGPLALSVERGEIRDAAAEIWTQTPFLHLKLSTITYNDAAWSHRFYAILFIKTREANTQPFLISYVRKASRLENSKWESKNYKNPLFQIIKNYVCEICVEFQLKNKILYRLLKSTLHLR